MSECTRGVRMRHIIASVLGVFFFLLPTTAQTAELSKSVKQVVRVDAAKVVLTHVRVIDGTGATAVEDQNVVIEDGKISAIQKGVDVAAAAGAAVLDLRVYTVMPDRKSTRLNSSHLVISYAVF